MPVRYDTVTARHYNAYRPPLHQLILERVLDASERFEFGLDFGCGTGQSTVALAPYCDHVYGVDSSQEMLERAKPHPKFTYTYATAQSLSISPGQPYDVVTFAGSLFYTKTETLRNALNAACGPKATIVVYDFNVLLDELLNQIDLPLEIGVSEYDYETGISDWTEFDPTLDATERLAIAATPQEKAHLLLSDSSYYDPISVYFGEVDPFDPLVNRLSSERRANSLAADIWYKRYQLKI